MTTERIEINPAIMMGKPVIRGTRITVELILRKLAEGASEGALPEDYPHLKTEDIRAAVAYGAASVAHEEVVLLPGPLFILLKRIVHDRLLKMRRYRSRYVLARDFMALFAALLWAGRYYTSTTLEKVCNPDWHNFSSYVFSTIAALIVLELFCWMVWHIQGLVLARQESLKPGDTPPLSVAIKHPTAKLFLSKFIPGIFLIGISTVIGAPTPCQPPAENASALQFVMAGLLLGGGFLLVGNTFIREVPRVGTG